MHRWLVSAAFCIGPVAASAQVLPKIPIESYSLPNGLKVILSPDRSTQVVTVDVWYDVGSRNEARGRTGFAHLFEHMMFQGSANVKKGEHFALIERAGGNTNGSTAEDRTNYYQMLPSNRLNLGLWLEADRMRSLTVSDSNFRNQREAVKEERRLRVENAPYAAVIFEGLFALQDSTTCFPYAHSSIGSMADLDSARVEDVQAFFNLHYAPNNATLVVTGDFDPPTARAMIEEYFGTIPRGRDRPAVECTPRFSPGLLRRPWPDPKATLPAVFVAYRTPPYSDPDHPALVLLGNILGQGESSRLNRSVVRDQRLAQGIFAGANLPSPRRGPGVLFLAAIANQGVAVDSLDHAVRREVDRLLTEGVPQAELEKAKNAFVTGKIQQQQISLYLAEAIQEANMFLGDPNQVNADPGRFLAVTTADLKRVAAKYLTPDNALVFLVTAGGAQ